MKRLSCAVALTAVAGIGIAAFASPALADIVFTLGNNPQPDEQNIQFESPVTGTSITGDTNQTLTPVFFSTLTGQSLLGQGQGQGSVFQNVANPSQNSMLTSMDINLTAPNHTAGTGVAGATLGFQDFIMNPTNGTGSATVEAFDNFGQEFTYTLGNGQNFLTLTTINNEFITDVQIVMSAGGSFTQFDQPRISGICTIGGTCPVPAPVVGAGLPGLIAACGGLFVLARRRRKLVA